MEGVDLSPLLILFSADRSRLARIKQDQAKSISKRAKPLGRKSATSIVMTIGLAADCKTS